MNSKVNEILNKIQSTSDDVDVVFQLSLKKHHKPLKKSRVTKAPTPDHIMNITEVVNYTISTPKLKYGEVLKQFNEANNIEPKEATESTRKSYTESVDEHGMLLKHVGKDSYYLQVYPDCCTCFEKESKYFMDGLEISKEKFNEIKSEWLSGSSSKDSNEPKLKVVRLSLDNLI